MEIDWFTLPFHERDQEQYGLIHGMLIRSVTLSDKWIVTVPFVSTCVISCGPMNDGFILSDKDKTDFFRTWSVT